MHFLDFYFAVMFFAGTYRRLGQYQSVATLVLSGPTRWPSLLKLARASRTIVLTWSTIMPAVLALLLWIAQLFASRFVFPEAGSPPDGLTVAKLAEHWSALLIVVPLGLAMFGFDVYSLYLVGEIDRALLEQYFEQA